MSDETDLLHLKIESISTRLIVAERLINDAKFAVKLTEKIVFAFVGLALVALAGSLIATVLK